MSISPTRPRVGANGGSGLARFASTVWPIRVRLQPRRSVCRERDDEARWYSAVKNWFEEMNVRGNWG